MAAFRKPQSSAEDESSRRYLASAPRGARTEVLAAACEQQIMELPISSADVFGRPVTMAEVVPTAQLVRAILFQDRDLSAFIARKVAQHLHVLMLDHMEGDGMPERLSAAAESVGLDVSDLERTDASDDDDPEGALALASMSFAVFRALVIGKDAGGDHALYVKLYTGAPNMDVEALAYDIISWLSITIARLINTGRARPGLVTFGPDYRHVPPMTNAGWYPNPANFGGIVDGDAAVQRCWDGNAWRDKMRKRDGRSWRNGSASLHNPPVD